jgi:hypothetical protein
MAQNSKAEELAEQARFVFDGTVRKLKASTIPQVDDKNRTVIVRVNKIRQSPPSLSHYGGQDITVKLAKGESVKVAQQATFFTNEWLFGKSVAVESLGHTPIKKEPMALAGETADPVRTLANRNIKKHFDDADLVLTGKVTSVHLPESEAAASASLRTREHDPMWRDAMVRVEDVHKGNHESKDIVVRFPASNDIAWRNSPKLHVGQTGHFSLHRSQMPASGSVALHAVAEEAGAGEEKSARYYTVLHPEDFQPVEEPGGIKPLLGILQDSEDA